ncbi:MULTISPECIES: endonuclease domain-containing protein [unclassified Microbacterium]|uniref:endonuclease domain-containing protein n=1 Tax=unclassified Microbacterium TaxID=2609290 RepID=UPI003415E32F
MPRTALVRPTIDALVRERGGVVRVRELAEFGFRRAAIESALREARLWRVRPGWVAVPDADPLVVQAARHGVVLSCLTQARRLGLWVHDERPGIHVAVTPGSAGGRSSGIRVHWAKPLIPRPPGLLVDPIENVLALVAECEPYEQALATWESALNQNQVDRDVLSNLPLRPRARRLLDEASPFADAGLETYVRVRLRWLRLPIRAQIWIAGHRVDILVGERLVIQIDGGHHVGAQRAEDIRHDAQLRLMGYHVIRVGYHQVTQEWALVQDLVMRAVAQGLHRAR